MTQLQLPKYQNTAKYLRTGANMCPPEMLNVHGKHNSFVLVYGNLLNGGTFTNREDPDAKLKSHIMQHLIRVYTVCYGKKELEVQKIQYFLEKFT